MSAYDSNSTRAPITSTDRKKNVRFSNNLITTDEEREKKNRDFVDKEYN